MIVISDTTPILLFRSKLEKMKEGLGLNLSDAVNMFLRQVILRKRIPFEVAYPEDVWEFQSEVAEAMEEARRITKNPNIKGYTDTEELES